MSNPSDPFTWLSTNRVEIRYDPDNGDCVIYWLGPTQPLEERGKDLEDAVAKARGSAEESSGDGIGGGE